MHDDPTTTRPPTEGGNHEADRAAGPHKSGPDSVPRPSAPDANGHTYKIWIHIEELDEYGDSLEDEPTLPEQYGEFYTLDEAQEALALIILAQAKGKS